VWQLGKYRYLNHWQERVSVAKLVSLLMIPIATRLCIANGALKIVDSGLFLS
jgi:hypothetical protein